MYSEVAPLRPFPPVAQAAREVTQVPWDNDPLPMEDVRGQVSGASNCHPNTMKTFVRCLARQGAARALGLSGRFRYRPLANREEAPRSEHRPSSIGSTALRPMVVGLPPDEQSPPAHIADLRDLLDGRRA
jgi:predicted transcriptional regulator